MLYLNDLSNFAYDSEKFSLEEALQLHPSATVLFQLAIEFINFPPLVAVDCAWEGIIFIGVREGVADELILLQPVCVLIHSHRDTFVTRHNWSLIKYRRRMEWGWHNERQREGRLGSGQSWASVADEFLTQDVALLQYLPCTWQILHCCSVALLNCCNIYPL